MNRFNWRKALADSSIFVEYLTRKSPVTIFILVVLLFAYNGNFVFVIFLSSVLVSISILGAGIMVALVIDEDGMNKIANFTGENKTTGNNDGKWRIHTGFSMPVDGETLVQYVADNGKGGTSDLTPIKANKLNWGNCVWPIMLYRVYKEDKSDG